MTVMKDSGVAWIGEIPEGWRIARIKNIFNVICGSTPSTENKELWDGGIFWITPAEMNESIYEIQSSVRTLTSQGVFQTGLTIVPISSIIISTRAPIGQVAIASVELCTNQGCKVLVSKKEIINKFFLYFFKINQSILNNFGNGTTFLELSTSSLENIKIPFPPKNEQHQIASHLDLKTTQIHNAISLIDQSIEKLKAYKQSVITEAVTKGLDPDVEMKDSGVEWIGVIPEGWECYQLSRICTDIQTGPFGSQLHSSDYIENGIPVINPVNIIDYNIYPDYRCSISTEMASSLHRHLLNEDEIIFARRGEMGRCALITRESDGFFCGTGCFKIQLKKKIIPKFIIYYLQIKAISAFLILNSSGTTLDNLNCAIISSLPCIVPPKKIQQDIISYLDHKCAQIDFLISEKQCLLDKLTDYKKSLIYECVTGKREV